MKYNYNPKREKTNQSQQRPANKERQEQKRQKDELGNKGRMQQDRFRKYE